MKTISSKRGFPSLTAVLSHAAVFACGAVIVFIGKGVQDESQGTAENGASTRGGDGRSAGPALSSRAEARASSGRARGETADKSPRSAETATARLGEIRMIGDPLDRQEALIDLINRLGPGEFQAVAEQFRNLEHFGNSRGEFDLIMRGWAKADPLGALAYATETLKSGERTALVLSTWAGNDPDAAERWALANHKGDGPNGYLSAVISGIALYDIDRASALAATMPGSHERGEAMDSIARALMVRGEAAAMAFPGTIQDADLRAGFVSIIADRLARRDVNAAASWLASMNEPDAQRRAARRVAEELARRDPAQAASWVGKLSPAARAEAARGVIDPMSRADIAGTAQWVSTLAGIPNYDSVV
ncbi:MAG: hypothetical protein MUF04_05255 [Akkermansiaceae bacterium]|nr:hypothetical protein [Akkermansiaceae bacterium]